MTNTFNHVSEIKGNLLTSDCDVIMHQANSRRVMGAGIAKQIKKIYPAAYQADQKDGRSALDRFGEFSRASAHNGQKPVEIVNLYGQLNYGRGLQTDYGALRSAIESYLFAKSNECDIKTLKIGVPTYMGCGLAGGDWNVVQDMLNDAAAMYGITIHTYTL